MTWLKENWIKVGILAIMLIAAGAVFYYYAIFLPSLWENDTSAQVDARQQSSTGRTGENSSEAESSAEMEFIPVGSSTSFADWDYKVTDVEVHSSIGDYTARGKYVIFMIEVTNNASSERQLGTLFQVENGNEQRFSFDTDASLEYHQTFNTDAWYLEDIGPSFTVSMPVAFDVSEQTKVLNLYPVQLRKTDLDETQIVKVELD